LYQLDMVLGWVLNSCSVWNFENINIKYLNKNGINRQIKMALCH
jgi:hypothetical protein